MPAKRGAPKKRTWDALADLLGYDHRTMHRWRKMAGAPAETDETAWREFIAAEGLGKDRSTKTLTDLKEENLRLDVALKRVKVSQAEGAMLSLDEMGDFITRFSARLDQLLTLKMETEGPSRIVGKEIVEVRREMRVIHDEIREIYNAGLLEWKPSPL